MNTQTRPAGSAVPILADHRTEKRLGNWTTRRNFEIRSRRGRVVLDLRSPQIPEGDIQIALDLDRAAVTLLVAEDAVVDQWDLTWASGGKVKQTFHHPAASTGRRVQLTGHIRNGEVRVHSGGIAQLSAICSREFLADARRAHADGGLTTLDDPSRGA